MQSLKLQPSEEEEQSYEIEKSSKMQENSENNPESHLHAPDVTTVGEENGEPNDRDEIIADLNFEGLEDENTVDVPIPSVKICLSKLCKIYN